MAGYKHRAPERVRRTEAVKSQAEYNQAVQQAGLLLSQAREQAHQIRQAALMEAERDAKAIREAAYAEGRAMANPEYSATEEEQRAIGRLRLRQATNEIYGLQAPPPKDSSHELYD
ncbi:hypothetical protein [Glutamicibacter sp. TV12E]|uniref:hypothetical protein n=1 Tax=Glutamicibacter sp. TV12E TaxID=3446362 RepID=UPI0040347614